MLLFIVRSGYYAAGRLEKTTVTDEDGLVTESFTDNGGKTVLNRYAYRYDYDPRGLLIEKRLPGVDPVYYVYDGKDRAVLSQDGNQRSGNRWSYTLYDSRNRATETGEVVLAGKTATQLRSEAGSSLDYLPSGTRTALQYCLYDSYTASPTVTPHAFVATPGYATAYHPLVTGQLTATKTRILGSDTWQTTTLYYDDLGRVIQTVGDNRLGGLSRTDMQYDFTGNLTHQRESHGKPGGSADVLESVNTYDAQGRLLTQSVSLNGGTAATLTYSYDALGRLTGKRYGSTEESLTYNVRGWLTGKESTPFRMRLRYAIPEGGSGARWNGSLSEWEWQHGTNAAMMYGLTYDGLNRFTGAVQKQKNGNTWSALSGDYVEKGLTYDRNGNLLTLQRTAGGSVVDNLAYTYTGNQLIDLSESVRTAPSNDIYAPGNAESGSYSYDANGNLQNDSRKSLNFSYNFLNLVSEVRTGGTVTAAYTWLADGTKLGVRNGSGSDGFEYVGSLIYRKSGGSLQLSEALFGNGVIRLNDNGTQEVNYFLTDHLGSVRVIVDGAGTVKECNDYYPFGARHIRSDYAQSTNRWKYNGKELQTTGDLGYLDYGARMYDTGLGRWFSADPEAENNLSRSPYHFSGNNPLLNVDPDGKDYWSTNDPALIGAFMNSLKYGFESHNFYGWHHATDADFTGDLTYNDITGKYYTSYGDVVNGEAVRIGLSFDARIIPRIETFGYEGGFAYAQPVQGFWGNLGYYTGISGRDKYFDGIATWEVNREGRITGLQPIAGVAPTPGLGKNAVFSFTKSSLKQGRQMHSLYKLGANGVKEYVLPSKRRIDFLDIENKIIYELKPFNPRSIKRGIKQLHDYKRELKLVPEFKEYTWTMILETY